MLSLGITQLNSIISESERIRMKQSIIESFNTKQLNSESSDTHYKNSYGGEVRFDDIYDRLTSVIKDVTKLNITKANSYSRIYFNDSVLKPHLDREGLDLTLSVQIENTFNIPTPIYGEGYDNTIYESVLNNGDAVLIKGGELKHWRNPILGEGYMICVFFHWTIEGLQYQEEEGFFSEDKCKQIISEADNQGFVPSAVLQGDSDAIVDYHSRSSQSLNWYDDKLNTAVKKYIGDLQLETWQLLKYEEGNQFLAHFDNGGHLNKRLFTILIYLNDDYEGGTTTFPNINLTIKPKTGKMIIFKNLNKGISDSKSLHSGDKIEKGTKYVLVSWSNIK